MNTFLTLGMEPFSTIRTQRTEGNRMDQSFTKNTMNGTERGWNDWKKNERERNDLVGGPRSRTKWNDFKKSWNVPSPS